MIGRNQPSDWENRLIAEVQKLQASGAYRELTLNRLKELVQPPSEQALVRALIGFMSDGGISVGYRLVSPRTHESLGIYRSPFEIPERVLDESTGEFIDVDRYQDVEAVYVNENRVAH